MSTGEGADDPIDILLVEPSSGDTRLFTESFSAAKLTNDFHTVTDGETALDLLHQRGEFADVSKPDLILLEPRLPGRSGWEIVSELEDDPEFSEIPVVVLTGSETEEEIVRSNDVEVDHYIQKPVEPEEFVEFVQEVEDFWLAIVQAETGAE